mmetsp:Transcript_33192/g.59421  ORF Transcript_33192/g.59421 Transcript_33192/m.59421 type:complete len:600 (-) Transcript_33192:493-2292(-)
MAASLASRGAAARSAGVYGSGCATCPTAFAPLRVQSLTATQNLVLRQQRGAKCGPLRAGRDNDDGSGVAEVQVAEASETSTDTADATHQKAETVGEVLRTRKQSDGKGRATQAPVETEVESEFGLNKINPYIIGKKSRAAFDDVWSKFARLGSFATSMDFVDDVNDLEAPQAAYTTVLLLGATGRVGRVMLRKLLLRGYSVKVLSRNDEAEFPKSAIVVKGDVGDYQQVREAVKGVDKVIYCASARSTFTGDLSRVDHTGVANVVKALQDQYNMRAVAGGKTKSNRAKPVIAEFKKEVHADAWTIEHVGPANETLSTRALNRGQDYASAKKNDKNLVFTGAVYSRTGYAEVGAQVDGQNLLSNTDGILMRILGDGSPYTCLLETSSGQKYSSRFNTKQGFSTVRLPFNTFRPLNPGNEAPIDPQEVARMSIRFEPRRGDNSTPGFKMEINFIKALPTGEEPDFVLISRTTQSSQPGSDSMMQQQLAKVIDFKKKGEEALRNSGLGYTIIRAGELVEEPGGYKALLFDQSDRIQDSISCADLADICVKGLHEPNARNKTFDVCNENFGKGGMQQYELIAHLPDKSSNYLKSALEDLQSMS